MWVLMLVLASCQDVAEETAQIEAAAVEPGYPSLHTVPPRPQLSYTVEQRRAIVDGLIADRANARYSSDVVRYRAGLSSLPPPAPPALAAVPPEPEVEAPDAADATPPPEAGPGAPAVPETEFLYEDDDLDSFMEEMVDDRVEPPRPADGRPGGEPEANAAPLGTTVIRASALRPMPQAAYPGRAPVVTLAMPPNPATLPVPAPVETALAGRAPGVVWGMPDMTPPPPAPNPTGAASAARGPRHAEPPPSMPADTTPGGRAPGVVWGMPDMTPAQAEPAPAVPETPAHGIRRGSPPVPPPIETALAGRAPGVVWGMPDMASAPAGRSHAAPGDADSTTTARAAPLPTPAKPRTAPADMMLAGAAAGPAPPAREPRPAASPEPAPVKPAQSANTALAMAEQSTAPAAGSTQATTATGAAPLPAPAKPALAANEAPVAPVKVALAGRALPQPVAAGIDVTSGLVAIDAAARPKGAAALDWVRFDPQSAVLSPAAVARLGRFLAEADAREARIKIVGEAAAPGLALDRALAVGLALVQNGVSADRLELTLAQGGSGDQARLFLAAPEL